MTWYWGLRLSFIWLCGSLGRKWRMTEVTAVVFQSNLVFGRPLTLTQLSVIDFLRRRRSAGKKAKVKWRRFNIPLGNLMFSKKLLTLVPLLPPQVLVPRVIGMYFLVGLAFFFYITRIPERFFNGKVDYLGHSHNLWHIIIVIALYYWHNTGKNYEKTVDVCELFWSGL